MSFVPSSASFAKSQIATLPKVEPDRSLEPTQPPPSPPLLPCYFPLVFAGVIVFAAILQVGKSEIFQSARRRNKETFCLLINAVLCWMKMRCKQGTKWIRDLAIRIYMQQLSRSDANREKVD
ncbi:uncharacterized protein LOC110068415 [Orbicella faveolata]|uniref:uncharacterized protein LOC110068415 n=1 Tax=Orbicella faveolata TaxID=48498 RepID=UPI0009E28754|nr:uncharacterized protein LOC110068415 [Orbicella faveolata]